MGKRVFQRASQMYPIVEDYLSQDQSQKQFSEDHKIPLHIFVYWVRKYKAEKAEQNSGSDLSKTKENAQKNFIPIKIIEAKKSKEVRDGGCVSINYQNGTSLRFAQGLEWKLLRKIMLQLNNDNL